MRTKRLTNDEILALLRDFGQRLGREPTETEINANRDLPSVGTIKNRFGSKRTAMQKAGFASPPSRERDDLLRHLQTVKHLLGRWPTRGEVNDAFRVGEIPVGSKSFYTEFDSWPAAVFAAGGPPPPAPISPEILLEEIRRVATLELADKPAGLAPSQKHFKTGGPFSFSMQAYEDHLEGYVDDWIREAGLEPRRLRSADPRADMLLAYRALYEQLGRLPATADVENAGLDFSAIPRHFGSLPLLRFELGLPLSDAGGKRGRDFWFYTGRNVEVADVLFDLLSCGVIWDYEYEVRINAHRRWRADFLVTRPGGSKLWVEFDGYNGAGRPGADYTDEVEKLSAYARLPEPLYVISESGYSPAVGTGLTLEGLRELLSSVRGDEASLADASPPLDRLSALEGISKVAESSGTTAVHVAWLCARGILRPPGELPSASEIVRLRDSAIVDELLSVEQTARELGMTRRVLDVRLDAGILTADHRKGSGTAYFFRSSLSRIRDVLGEKIFEGDRSALIAEETAAERAGISSSLLRILVRTSAIHPSESRLVGGRILRFYSPQVVQSLAEAHGAESPPDGWVSASDLANATGASSTTIQRLISAGTLEGALYRPRGFAGARAWYFPPESIEVALRAMPRVGRSG